MSNRDNFTKQTIDILAKRVGYICSNPECRTYTVGPNLDTSKATLIGIAAHITAASTGGPRYEQSLSEIERTHIDNGIWLCSNCATLIDKDERRYSRDVLRNWKEHAENEMLTRLSGLINAEANRPIPFLEADLIWNNGSRLNRGYSNNNYKEIHDGKEVFVFGIEYTPIIFWQLNWNFSFSIHNNSSVPAYNLKVLQVSEIKFRNLSSIENINNLPPYQSLDLEASYSKWVEGTHTQVDDILKFKIPKDLEGLALELTYLDEHRNLHSTHVSINNNKNFKR
jgi:hypothetical protein